jgi:hypothetical protein
MRPEISRPDVYLTRPFKNWQNARSRRLWAHFLRWGASREAIRVFGQVEFGLGVSLGLRLRGWANLRRWGVVAVCGEQAK